MLFDFITSLIKRSSNPAAEESSLSPTEEDFKKDQARLRESHRLALVGTWEFNLKTRALFWSDEVYRMFDVKRETFEPGYESFFSLVHPDDRVPVENAFLTSLQNRTPLDVVHRTILKDGQVKFMHQRCETFFDSSGNPERSVGAVQDITKQFLESQELIETRQRLESFIGKVINNAPFGAHEWELKDDGGFVLIKCNTAAERILGGGRDEFIGKDILEAFPNIADSPILNAYKKVAMTGEPYETEQFLYRDNKVSGIYDIVAFQTAPKRMLVFFRDVTERKKMEITLLDAKRRSDIIESVGRIGYWENNIDGSIGLWSDQTYDLFEQKKGEFTPSLEWALELMPLGDQETVKKHWNMAANQGLDSEFEYTIRLPSGRTCHHLANIRCVKDTNGKVLKVFGTVQDDTEKKLAQDTAILNQRLESLGVLAGGIAHDFNNLLGGLFGYLDMARRLSEPGSKVSRYLTKSMEVFTRTKDLTKQLLTFSKGGDPVRKSHSMGDILKRSLSISLSGSQLTAAPVISDDLWMCNVDENQIGQALDNIIINARQAMPEGGKINITAENFTAGERDPLLHCRRKYVKIRIEDFGPGIPVDVMPRVFEPFFTTKRTGSGLGLATAYSIIKRHDGVITIESESGKGTAVNLWLPACARQISETEKAEEKEFKGKGRVMILDDEMFISEVAKDYMTEIGYTVTCVSDGAQALTAARQAAVLGLQFEYALLDLTIPGGKGGQDIIQELKEVFPNIKAIASSGYSDAPVMANPENYGFTASLAKPYVMSDLTKTLDKLSD